jgi:hypothetical protein
MINTYIWAECTSDLWPTIEKITATSYNDAVEKLINKYSLQLDDDDILKFDDWKQFREYLNDEYCIALSDIEILEEI